jgi:hypothetical protein
MDYEKLANLSAGDPAQAVRNWVAGFFVCTGRIQIERVRLING